KVVRDFFYRRSRCGRNASKISLHEFPGDILHLAVRDVVLHRVDQLNVADRVGRLLDQAGNPLIALTAETDWPVYRGAHADFALPVGAGFRKKVRPDVGSAATVGTMHN